MFCSVSHLYHRIFTSFIFPCRGVQGIDQLQTPRILADLCFVGKRICYLCRFLYPTRAQYQFFLSQAAKSLFLAAKSTRTTSSWLTGKLKSSFLMMKLLSVVDYTLYEPVVRAKGLGFSSPSYLTQAISVPRDCIRSSSFRVLNLRGRPSISI